MPVRLAQLKHSNPYNKIGVHLFLTSSKMTSSEANKVRFPDVLGGGARDRKYNAE